MIFGAFDKSLTKTRIKQMSIKLVTVPTYLALYPTLDSQIARAQQLRSWGLEVVAHPVLYGMLDDPMSMDAFIERMSAIYKMMPLYAIDVVNEPYHYPMMDTNAYYARCNGFRRINEYGIFTGEITDDFVRFLQTSREYDGIGVQAHVSRDVPFATVWNQFSAQFMRAQIDKLRVLEKVIDISEISIPSRVNGWTETRQRDFLLRLYESVEGLVRSMSWWETVDAPDMWNPSSGLYRRDGTAKPALYAWREIVGGI